jgi:hypothetical protein
MPSNFPTGPDTIINNVANTTPELDTHPNVHNQLADAVMAVENSLLPGGPMNLAAHEAAADPHPVYLTQPEGDARYALIGSGGGGGSPTGPAGGALSGTYPNPTLAANSVATGNIIDGTIAAGDLATGAAASNVGTLGGALTGTLPNPGLAGLPTNSVGNTQIADGAVTSAKIADATIQALDMAAGAAASNVGTLGGSLSGTLPNPTVANGSITSAMIADGTITGTDIATGTITSTQIQDGTIQSADIAVAGISNDRLGPDVARANLLTNGGFEIWQRGNGPFTATGSFCADRWQLSIGGGSTLSVSRDTINVDTGSLSAAAVTYTHSVISNLTHPIEDFTQLRGRTIAFSARVRTSVANAVALRVDSQVAGTLGAYHTGDGTWQTLSATYTVPANATRVIGLIFFFASCTAYLDNAMLVVGSQPANYVPMHPADDLARCLRYYEVIQASGAGGSLGFTGMAYATANATAPIPFRVKKAVTPTLTFSAPTNYGCLTSNATQATCSAISASQTTVDQTYLSLTLSGTPLTTGNATILWSPVQAGTVIIEANP